MSVMALTLLLVVVSVRSKEDFVAGALGLGMCAMILCIRGFIRGPGSFGSINPIEGSQKNAFSLFYLPASALPSSPFRGRSQHETPIDAGDNRRNDFLGNLLVY